MTITNLINLPCQIVRRTPSGLEDDYGNEIPGETVVSTVCEFQKLPRSSDQEDASRNELAESRWNVFFPAGTDVDSGDALIIGGTEYEVDGDPWDARNPLTDQVSHVELMAKRVAGADDDGGGS